MENKLGQIYFINYEEINTKNIEHIKQSFVIDVDDSELKNPFPYYKSKDRKLSLERFENFFYENLVDGHNIKIFVPMSAIENSLESGKDVFLLSKIPTKHSHGKTIFNYFKNKLEQGEIQYAEPKENEEGSQTAKEPQD